MFPLSLQAERRKTTSIVCCRKYSLLYHPVKGFDVAMLQGQFEDMRCRELLKGKFVPGMCENLRRN